MQIAGELILKTHCDDFPSASTKTNNLLPPYHLIKFPEYRDETTHQIIPHSRGLVKKEPDQFRGILTGQSGELAENIVFNAIAELSCQSHIYPFLAMFNFNLDNDNQHSIRGNELRHELPTFPVSIKTNIELDAVVFLRDLGAVVLMPY